MTGCLNYMGPSLGYGLPYGTQYTAPTRIVMTEGGGAATVRYRDTVPQAEPNGLFMPPTADGTWVMMKNPTEDKVQAVYFEPRVIVAPFRMTARECPEAPKKP